VLALEIADLKGQRLGMVGGVADAFDDETGVDIKTNAVYDATNDRYSPSPVGTTSYSNPRGTGNRTASITVTTSGFTISGNLTSTLVDGNLANTSGYLTTSNEAGHFQLDFGTAKYIDEVRIQMAASYMGAGPWSWSGSNDGSAYTSLKSDINLISGSPNIFTVPAYSTAYRDYRLSTANRGSGSVTSTSSSSRSMRRRRHSQT
jgi:hypothetical protein